MQRKRPITAVEILADRLVDKGYEIDCIRQPIPSQPGFVTFSDKRSPKTQLVIKVIETFLDLQNDLVEKIAEAERELERARVCKDSPDETEPS